MKALRNGVLSGFENHPYRILNLFFGLLIMAVFTYTGLRAGQAGPSISCFYKSHYGIECPSCGLTRAFGSILRGDWYSALKHHGGSFWFFGFFAAQLLMRLLSEMILLKKWIGENRLALYDGLLSAVFFIVCFGKGYGIF